MTKVIKGFENYLVTKSGEVYSLPKRTRKCKIKLTQIKQPNGYLRVDLCRDGEIKRKLVHRIVAEAYLPNHENKEQVNHINGIKNDQSGENLEWNTASENQLHAVYNGLRSAKGSKNSQAKLNEDKVIAIRMSKSSLKELAKKYFVSVTTISEVRNNKIWTHISNQTNQNQT